MKVQSELPVALLGGKRALSTQACEEIKPLMQRRPLAFLWQAVLTRLVIIGVIWWAVLVESIWVSVLAIFIVATR